MGVDSNKFEASELRTIMAELTRGFEAGALEPPHFESVPFDRAIASFKKVAAQAATSKLVRTFK